MVLADLFEAELPVALWRIGGTLLSHEALSRYRQPGHSTMSDPAPERQAGMRGSKLGLGSSVVPSNTIRVREEPLLEIKPMKKREESFPERPTALITGVSTDMSLTLLTRQFLPGMIARVRGRILNLASLTAFFDGGSHLGELFPRTITQAVFTFLSRGQGPDEARWQVLS